MPGVFDILSSLNIIRVLLHIGGMPKLYIQTTSFTISEVDR